MEIVYRVIYSVNGTVTSDLFSDKRVASNAARKFSKQPYGTKSRIYKCFGTWHSSSFHENRSVYVTTYKEGKRSASF